MRCYNVVGRKNVYMLWNLVAEDKNQVFSNYAQMEFMDKMFLALSNHHKYIFPQKYQASSDAKSSTN